MKKDVVLILILVVSLTIFLTGCQRMGTFCPSPGVCVYPEEEIIIEDNSLEDITGEIIIEEPIEIIEADIIVTEGELVKLSPEAADPEGGTIEYIFSAPLNEKGEWQTKVGDAGYYTTTIIASDGVNEVSQEVSILVLTANRAPVMGAIDDITVTEGDTITLEPDVTDPEGDNIDISYSGWMKFSSYKTTYDDAGEHIVTITADDGINEVSQDVTIIVTNFNRPPVMEKINDIALKEGDPVAVRVDAADPDGDDLTIEFSEPLDASGEWLTEMGDAGTYNIIVTVSDGEAKVSQDFDIIIESVNKAPVIEISNVEVDEGQKIVLKPTIKDPDGYKVDVSYSGWMTSAEYQTTYDDAGEHIVTITADDGIIKVNKDITITVNDVNRPPEFVKPY